MTRLEEIAAAGRAAVGDRQPTQAEAEAIAVILAPIRDEIDERRAA